MIVPHPLARPDSLDSRSLQFRAVVDWIEFEILTARPTQFPYIQGHLEYVLDSTPYVTPIDPETGDRKTSHGGTTNAFRFRVYDHYANTYEATLELFSHLAGRFALVQSPRITGLEMSFDAYCSDDDKLRRATRWMMAHLSAPNDNVRKFDPVTRKMRPVQDYGDPDPTDPMRSLCIHPKSAPLTYRVYMKQTDGNRDDEGKALPRKDWRARAEFTLTQSKLDEHGLLTLGDLASVDFGKLGAEYIRFANLGTLGEALEGKDAFQAEGLRALWDGRAVCLAHGWNRRDRGQDGYRKHARPTGLKTSRYATMNEPVNRIVTREFRDLGKRYLHVSD